MAGPLRRVDSTPIFTPRPKGLFGTIADTIHWFLFPEAMKKQQDDQIATESALLSSASAWQSRQLHRIQHTSTPVFEDASNDQIELFFRDFFSHLATKYLEVTVIEQVKTGISTGLSESLKSQAPIIVDLILTDRFDMDISSKEIRSLIDKAIAYLFQACPTDEEKKKIISQAIKESKSAQGDKHVHELIQNCTIYSIELYVGPNQVKPFLKSLGKQLVPKTVQLKSFLKNFSGAVYETIKPFLESTLEIPQNPIREVSNVSPLIKVFTDLFASHVSKRITLLWRSVDLKSMFDNAIQAAFNHVQAHNISVHERDRVKDRQDPLSYYVSAFAAKEGCHPAARALMTPTHHTAHLEVRNTLEQFSTTLIDFVFDPKTVETFVTHIRMRRSQLERENQGNPLVLRMIHNLCDPAHADLLNNFILNLKPLAITAVAKGVATLGFTKIFPHNQIYKILYEQIAPPLLDLIRKGMVKKIIATKLKETIPAFLSMYPAYLQNPAQLDCGLASEVIENYYTSQFKRDLPIDIKKQIPEALKDLLEILKKQGYIPGIGDDYEKRLRDYFNSGYRSDKVQVYGQLLMYVILGVSKIGIVPYLSLFRDNPHLIVFFRDVFLDGVSHLRGVDNNGEKIQGEDPNQILFDLIKHAILPYQDPYEVQQLLQGAGKPWDEATIESRTKEQAKILADLLADLIELSIPVAGRPVASMVKAVDLQGHLVYALTVLFENDQVNYNLFFQILEILNAEIKKLNGHSHSI